MTTLARFPLPDRYLTPALDRIQKQPCAGPLAFRYTATMTRTAPKPCWAARRTRCARAHQAELVTVRLAASAAYRIEPGIFMDW